MIEVQAKAIGAMAEQVFNLFRAWKYSQFLEKTFGGGGAARRAQRPARTTKSGPLSSPRWEVRPDAAKHNPIYFFMTLYTGDKVIPLKPFCFLLTCLLTSASCFGLPYQMAPDTGAIWAFKHQ